MAVALIVPTRRFDFQATFLMAEHDGRLGASESLSPPAGLVHKRSGSRGIPPAPTDIKQLSTPGPSCEACFRQVSVDVHGLVR